MMIESQEVLSFIDRFTRKGMLDQVVDTFSNGSCYWFATILFVRFYSETTEYVYDPTVNHFGTMIDGRVFDITGDVTEQYRWLPWKEDSDQYEYSKVFRNSVLFKYE